MIKHFLFSLVILIICKTPVTAQEKSTQIWTDFTFTLPLKNRYTFDTELSYRTIVGTSDKWHSFNVIPKIEKALGRHWDILLYLGSINTVQQTDYNTYELRPGLGVRFHFSPVNKLMLRILVRAELRNQYTTEVATWTHDIRTRYRLEEIYFINGKSYADNHLWYLLSDQEVFFTPDKELEERFSNRALFRLGLGYKLSDHWRYECFYTYQFSKNTIDGEFSKEQEGILRIRFRYSF